jgi:hypothetical protein
MDRSVFSKAVEITGDRGHRAQSVPHGARSVQSKRMGDPGDLVTRALGILAEDRMKGNEARPTDLRLQRRVLTMEQSVRCRSATSTFNAWSPLS